MTEQEKETLKEQLREAIASGRVLRSDRQGKGFLCPSCGNGSGKTGQGLHFKKGGDLLYCFSCGSSFDPFEALKAEENLSDFETTLDRACQICSFTPSEAPQRSSQGSSRKTVRNDAQSSDQTQGRPQDAMRQKQPQKASQEAQDREIDYSQYFEECFNRNDGEYLLSRGISAELQIERKIGYDPSWVNPESEKDPQVARVIIPTSRCSYIARKAGSVNPKFDDRIRKVGTLHLYGQDYLYNSEREAVFVTEGEIDALSFEEIGYKAVGLGGTSGANLLKQTLRRVSNPPILILALDNDKAGDATVNGKRDDNAPEYLSGRGLSMDLKASGVEVYVAEIPREVSGKAVKDSNDFLIADRTQFEEWAQEQIRIASQRHAEEARIYLAENAVSLDYFEAVRKNSPKPIPTGFERLDKFLRGGLSVGLTTLGAGTSFGKTALAVQIAENMARNGQDVIFFSLEMAKYELIARSLSRLTGEISQVYKFSFGGGGASFAEVMNPEIATEDQRNTIAEAKALYKTYAPHLFLVESQGEFTVQNIREAVRKHRNLTGRTPVVFIDYLQVLHPVNPRETEKQQTDRNILELRRIARDYQAVIVALASLNRGGYANKPTLENFKESGGVEYGSDIVLMLSFEGQGEEKDSKGHPTFDVDTAKRKSPRDMNLTILKNRNGNPTTTVPVFSYARYSLFREKPLEQTQDQS